MANLISTDFDYIYPGKVSTEVFYKPSVETPDILQLFTVRSGIKSKEQLNRIAPLSKITKAYSGCGSTFTETGSTNPVNVDNQTLEVDEFEFRLSQCPDTFNDTILEELKNSGVRANDLSGTTLQTIAQRVILDALRRDNFRHFSFGDKAASSSDYNVTDGLFRRLFDGASAYVQEVDDISTLNQSTNTRAIDYFRNLWEGAESILAQLPSAQKKLFVTRNVFDNYLTNLEDKSNTDQGVKYVQDGIQRAFFRGVEVVPIYAWDDFLADADNPFNSGVESFNTAIVYTTPQNHIIGVERAADQGNVEQWYEKKDRTYYFQGQYNMGYNYLQDDLQAYSVGTV